MATKMKFGVVGLGGIADYHVKSFLADERVEIAACCDIRSDRLEAFTERYQVPHSYRDYEKMLDEAGLDIVVVCTDETLHAKMTVQAAARRPKAILCEKPMAMSLREADAMKEACEKNDVMLIIGHQRRFKPQYARAKELLKQGVIGNLEQIQSTGHEHSSLLVDGTHLVNLVRFFLDDEPADWVMGQIDAQSGRFLWNHVCEDASLALIKFRNGVRAWLTCGGYLPPAQEPLGTYYPFSGDHYTRFILIGATGQIIVEGDYPPEDLPPLRVVKGDKVEIIGMEHPSKDKKTSYWHNALSPQADLLNALEDGHRHELNGESARADLELLLAVYESSLTRRIISIPLQNKDNPLDQILAEREN